MRYLLPAAASFQSALISLLNARSVRLSAGMAYQVSYGMRSNAG